MRRLNVNIHTQRSFSHHAAVQGSASLLRVGGEDAIATLMAVEHTPQRETAHVD